jgi:L-ribulose-5-phosphate 4-epimerase
MNAVDKLVEKYHESVKLGIDFGSRGVLSLRSGNDIFTKRKVSYSNAQIQNDDIVRITKGDLGSADPRSLSHMFIFETFPNVNAVVQLDARWCSIWASQPNELPPLSSLHADNFFGPIRVTSEICGRTSLYSEIGSKIIELFQTRMMEHTPAVFVRNFGAITWGESIEIALERFLIIEELCLRAWQVHEVVNGKFAYMPYKVRQTLFDNVERR